MAGLVDQDGPFTAQRFGAQGRRIEAGIERGRVELHEFRITDHRAQTGRHGHGLALRDRRCGGQGEQAAGAAHGEQGGVGLDGFDLTVRALRNGTGAGGGIARQRNRLPAITHLDVSGGANRLDQRRHDRRAGTIALHPCDPGPRMRRFAGQRPVRALALKRRAKFRQFRNFRRRTLSQGERGLAINQPGSCSNRVPRMQLSTVIRRQSRRHPALRPTGRGAVTQRCAGEQNHRPRGELESCPKPGNTSAADEGGVGHRS